MLKASTDTPDEDPMRHPKTCATKIQILYCQLGINSWLRGKTAVVLPTSSPRRVGFLAGICWTKSRSPRYSLGLGGVVTNDLCIKVNQPPGKILYDETFLLSWVFVTKFLNFHTSITNASIEKIHDINKRRQKYHLSLHDR